MTEPQAVCREALANLEENGILKHDINCVMMTLRKLLKEGVTW